MAYSKISAAVQFNRRTKSKHWLMVVIRL